MEEPKKKFIGDFHLSMAAHQTIAPPPTHPTPAQVEYLSTDASPLTLA